ncbi:MAG: 2-oxoacid:acceptor oxidoreductase subunit alpha [Candidatus Firestonebacteria bacterium]
MSIDISIVISGQAGQGVQSIAFTLAKVFTRAGYFTFTYHDIMSRIRGGNNSAIIRIKESPIDSIKTDIDLLICLDKEAIIKNTDKLKDTGILIYDGDKIKLDEIKPNYFSIPLEKIALEIGKNKLMSNSVATGSGLALMNWNLDGVIEIITQIFKHKGEDIINANINSVKAGYDYVKKNFTGKCPCEIFPLTTVKKNRLLISGSESIAIGAVASGLKFYSGYPMSPSTAIMEFLTAHSKEYNIVVEQAEDEISAVNMIIGASYAGVRVMTATSGGGFCLMVEGLSLAGMVETPIVIVIGQRPGPATGFPTRTEQGELKFVLNAGHGEFPRIIFAPRTAKESIYLMTKAFNLAEKYQIPAIILVDQYFNDSYWTVDSSDINKEEINREGFLKETNLENYKYKRYSFAENGVSPRIIPGTQNQVSYADSDEHTEEGHITENAEVRVKMVEKRLDKLKDIINHINQPLYIGNNLPEIVLIGWGSTFGAMKEALDLLNEKGVPTGLLHFSEVYPLPELKLDFDVKTVKKIYCVENNATGQFADLFELHTGIKIKNRILKYDGRPFTAKYIIDKVGL